MDLVQRVHDGVAAALAHADVPQMQVVAELARRQQLLAFNAIPYQVNTFCYGHFQWYYLVPERCLENVPGDSSCLPSMPFLTR